MTAPARIRVADIDDAAALSGLGASTFIETFGHLYRPEDLESYLTENHSPAYYADFLRAPGTIAWLATDARDEPAGYAMAGPCGLGVEGAPALSGELKRVYLAKQAQGRGLGKALVEVALDWLEARFSHVYLSVYSENYRAQALYRRYGFEKVAEHHFMVGTHADLDWIMAKTPQKG